MVNWREQNAIPYIPVHRPVVPEGDYLGGHTDILLGRFGREGLLDLSQLQRELENILSTPGVHFDKFTAHLALQKLQRQTQQVKIETATQILGEALFQQLVLMLNLREDEAYFAKIEANRPSPHENDYSYLFDAFKNQLERYKINPENTDAFRQVAHSLYPRFQKLLATTANFGIWAGRFQEAAQFLEPFVVYHKEGKSYSFSDAFVPLYANPNFPFEVSAEWQSDPHVASGYQLLQGLELCLQNDVEGTHNASDPILHDLASNAKIRIDLPSAIEIEESTEVIFDDLLEINIQGLRYHMEWSQKKRKYPDWLYYWIDDWKIYNEPFKFYWGLQDPNGIYLRATKDANEHAQYSFPITGQVILENMEWFEFLYGRSLAPKIETVANIRNENEPPSFSIHAPRSIEEGGLFCMKLEELTDPEFDPLSIRWEQKGGPTVKLIKYDHGQKVCAQAPVTKGVEPPYQFVVTMTDHPPANEPVSKKSVQKEVTVLHMPAVQLATGEPVVIPEEVIRILTDPKEKDKGAIGIATSSYLYVFLRLPADIEHFSHQLTAPIAEQMNVIGTIEQAHSPRLWSNFVKIPGNVFAYMSASPIRAWTRPHQRFYFEERSRVDLDDQRYGLHIGVPVQGYADTGVPANPIEIRIDENGHNNWKRVKNEEHLSYSFGITDPKANLHLPEKVSMETAIFNDSQSIILTSSIPAKKLIETESPEKIKYRLSLPLAEVFLPPNAIAQMSFELTNQEGEKGTIQTTYQQLPLSNAQNFWGAFSLNIPDKIMPFPWILAELKLSDPKWTKEFSHFIKGNHRFQLTVQRTNEDGKIEKKTFSLQGAPKWNWQKDDQTIYVPLRFDDNDALVAKGWVRHGGILQGKSTFSLPSDSPNSQGWKTVIKWPTPVRVPPIPGYTEYPEPEFAQIVDSWLPLLAPFLEELEMRLKGVKIETVESQVKAGESFHIRITLPDDPEKFQLDNLFSSLPLNKALITHMWAPDQNDKTTYSLRGSAVERNKNTWTLTYQVPDYLPRGKYITSLDVAKEINAHYVIFRKNTLTGKREFEYPITRTVIPDDQDHRLKLIVIGKEEIEQPIGKGGMTKK